MKLAEKQVEAKGVRRVAYVVACAALTLATCGTALALRVNPAGQTGSVAGGRSENGPVRVSAGVMAGNAQQKVSPVYPQAAKNAKIQGAVVLRAVIDIDGTVKDLEVIAGPEELRESALTAVKQWAYKPYLLNGRPTAVETTITVNYALAN